MHIQLVWNFPLQKIPQQNCTEWRSLLLYEVTLSMLYCHSPPPLNDPAGKVAIRVRMLAPRDNWTPLLPLAPVGDIEISELHFRICVFACISITAPQVD